LAFVVLFQPELRRVLVQLTRTKLLRLLLRTPMAAGAG
jgi:hypothetical protein